MTHRLLPGSDRYAAAIAFGQHMDEVMRRKGIGKVPLGLAAGVSKSAIGEYRHGRNLPTRQTAARLARALGSRKLLQIVEDARRGACATCGALVWQDFGRPTLYCSIACRNIGGALQHAAQRRGTRADRELLTGTLSAYREAVAAFCGECPDNDQGFCANAACPLFVVTPLRKDGSTKEAELAVRPDPYTAEASANRSEGLRRAHAARPEWGAATGRRSREWHASMSPEERDAWRAAISTGRRPAA